MSIGQRIIAERKKRDWSAARLAKESGLKQHVLFYIEAGRRDPNKLEVGTVRKLAQALGVSVDYLIGMYEEQYTHANT
jgi:transcriptional regulator with XRE-family HTH domain